MHNLLYLKNKETSFTKAKFVFQKMEKPSAQPPAPGSLAERIEKKFNTNLNVESNFNPDLNLALNDLGKKAQEKNNLLNAESIKQNLQSNLAEGKTVEDAWAFLQSKNCKTIAIINGDLRFFAGPKGSNEIMLSELYKPLEMKIDREGTVTHEYLLRRQEMMNQTMQALQALKGELPDVPPNKIS